MNTMRQVLVPAAVAPNIQRSANHPDFPLKIVINAKYIGAIIGHGGSTIRDISKVSRARCMVDVNNPTYDDNGNQENIIWITGTLENCSQACLKFLQVIQTESKKDPASPDYIELKIRVPNQLVGRLIGKNGSSVKKIMGESGATVTINDSFGQFPLHENVYTLERVITIHASSMNAVTNAERIISQKLRNCYESDLKAGLTGAAANVGGALMNVPPLIIGTQNASVPEGLMSGFAGPPPVFNASGGYPGWAPPTFYRPAAGPAPAPINLPYQAYGGATAGSSQRAPNNNMPQMKCQIYIPDLVMGTAIGTKELNIQNIMLQTGANIAITIGNEARKRLNPKNSTDSASTVPSLSTSDKADSSLDAFLKDDEKATDSPGGEKEKSSENLVKDELSDGETGQSKTSDTKEDSKEDEVEVKPDMTEELDAKNNNSVVTTKNEEKVQPNTPAQPSVSSSSIAPPPSKTLTSNLVGGSAGKSSEKTASVRNSTAVTGNLSGRCVEIVGFDKQVLQAEFWVFQRIAERTIQFIDELVLTTETFVPSKIVGRIIGKNGQNVRELQRITQAIVKVPDDLHNPGDANGETPVRVTGNYFALQAVQCRFSVLIAETEQRESEQNKRSRVSSNKGGNFSASQPNENSTATALNEEKVVGSSV